MNATHLQKKLKLPLFELVRFHVVVELTVLRNEPLIASDLAMLTLLVQQGQQPLPTFCEAAARLLNPNCTDAELATRAQNVRNRLVKLEKRKLVVKSRPATKTLIEATGFLRVPLDKPLLLDYQFLSKSDAAQALISTTQPE